MKRRRLWILPFLGLCLGLTLAFFLFGRSHLATGFLEPTQLMISDPADGSTAPLHSTLPVVGDAESAVGVRRLELWVNSQKWGEAIYGIPGKKAHKVWDWTPSGEGKHVLLLRAVDTYGRTLESATVTVYASAAFDVLFPLSYTAHGGETFAGLAPAYDTTLDALAASNPGLGPDAPLSAGQQITIPVPIPNADPASPQSGEPPVPPAGPLPGSKPAGGGSDTSPETKGALDLSMLDTFKISPTGIILNYPVEQVYAYVSLAGQPWRRLPDGEFNFLPGSGNTFDLKPYLTPQLLAGLPSPTSFDAYVWGWAGGNLAYLGHQSGVIDATQLDGRALTSTKLAILGRVRDSISYESEWNIPSPIPDYFAGFKQGFQWTTSVPGITGGMWQLSTTPFAGNTPLVDTGMLPGPNSGLEDFLDAVKDVGQFFGGNAKPALKPVSFSIDFSKYIELPPNQGGFAGFIETLQKLTQPPPTWVRSDPSWPETFYVRVLPIMGNQLGEPSNTVIVHYGPPEPQPLTDATGPLFDVKVLSFTPYRASDPKYMKCAVLSEDIKTCHTEYSLNLIELGKQNQKMQNVIQVAAQSGNLGALKGQFPTVIEESTKCDTSFPKGTQSCGCPGVSCSSGSSCSWGSPLSCVQEGLEWGLKQLKAAANWVSEKYAEVKKFAVDSIMKYTGIGALCDAAGGSGPCRVAVELAVDYGLAAMGLPPTIPNFSEMLSQGEDYLVQVAVQELKDKGLPCDSTCESAIKAGYDEIKKGASNSGGGSGAGGVGMVPNWQPHPLAVEQPATLLVSVTRRPETGGIPDNAASSCSLIVWNTATNSSYGGVLQGAPFSGVGKKIPLMLPGDSVTIPIGLTRIPWNPPADFSPQVQGAPAGAIVGAIAEADVGQWLLLYYGSSITFDLRSQGFSIPGADGKKVNVKCMDNFKYPVQIQPH